MCLKRLFKIRCHITGEVLCELQSTATVTRQDILNGTLKASWLTVSQMDDNPINEKLLRLANYLVPTWHSTQKIYAYK